MSIGRICIREVHVADPDESLLEAARRMRDRDVGTLVVVDAERRPVGILTDRDLATRCVAAGCDPAVTKVGSAMTVPVTTAVESTPIEEGIARMSGVPARRLVVVDEDDHLVGVLALDDVLELLVEEMETLGRLVRRAGSR
ncbi:MAG: CBS domain-containing protein [Myxococcota bacterium]|nr:CBS domain-containing protein [Myxococcota bacterium]